MWLRGRSFCWSDRTYHPGSKFGGPSQDVVGFVVADVEGLSKKVILEPVSADAITGKFVAVGGRFEGVDIWRKCVSEVDYFNFVSFTQSENIKSQKLLFKSCFVWLPSIEVVLIRDVQKFLPTFVEKWRAVVFNGARRGAEYHGGGHGGPAPLWLPAVLLMTSRLAERKVKLQQPELKS